MTNLKRIIICVVSLLLCALFQFTLCPMIFPRNAVPNLLLILTFSFGFLWGRNYGIVIGLVSGLLLDTVGGGTFGFNTLIFSWLGYFNGYLAEKMETEMIVSLLLLMLLNELIYHLYVFVFGFFIRLDLGLFTYIGSVFIPEVVVTLICMIFVYGFINFLNKKWNLMTYKGVKTIV